MRRMEKNEKLAMQSWLKNGVLHERAMRATILVMPFGKYQGYMLEDVPLRYLDETVSVMPQTWFIREVIHFVSWAQAYRWEYFGPYRTARLPDESLDQLNSKILSGL